MMKNSLYFKEPPNETRYQLSRLSYQGLCFKILTLTLLLQSAGIFLANPMKVNFFQPQFIVPFIISMFLLIIGYIFVVKRLPNHRSKFIILFVISFIIGGTEVPHLILEEEDWKAEIYFFLGVNLQMGCLFLAVSRIDWIHNTLALWISETYIWSRAFNLDKAGSMARAGLISYGLYLILLPMLCYAGEQLDRHAFLEKVKREKNLESFQKLIEQIIPNSLVIMKGEEIVFFNDVMKEMFSIQGNEEVKQIMNCIQIHRESCSATFDANSSTVSQISGASISINLYDLAISHLIDQFKLPLQNFITMEGIFIPPEQKEIPRSYSIQIGNIVWNNENSLIIIINDITTIKRYYKHVGQHNDQLLATVSHELMTPLNGVFGMLESALEDIKERDIREKLLMVGTSAKLLSTMINNILDFSLLTKGKLRLNYESTPLSSLAKEALLLFQSQAELKGLSLKLEDLTIDNPQTVKTDSKRLFQVLISLIHNAVKFTKAGSIILRIKEEIGSGLKLSNAPKSEKDKGHNSNKSIFTTKGLPRKFVFEVEDTGVGINPEKLSNIFRMLGRIDPHETLHDTVGIGLGLTISQNLIKLLNSGFKDGEIQVVSSLGFGSKFSFPLYIEDDTCENIDENFNAIQPFPFVTKPQWLNKNNQYSLIVDSKEPDVIIHGKKRIKILIVDDDKTNLIVASNYLNNGEDFTYETAIDGMIALKNVQENARKSIFYDIILMDCNMPVLDGYEATRRLKNMMIMGEVRPCPIIAVTANVGSSDREKCLATGMDDFLQKPFKKVDLLTIVHKNLR